MNENQKSTKMSGNLRNFTITPPKLKPKLEIDWYLHVLKPLACVIGPLTIPTIVYGVEGCTTLFWCILGVASFTSILLLTFDKQKIKDFTKHLKLSKCGVIRCLVQMSLILLMCGGATYAYHIHQYEIVCVCMFVIGFITGTLISDFPTWREFRRNKNLPFVSYKNSPKPVRPVFLDLRRKSLNVSRCVSNFSPLKRQLSSPAKKSSNFLNCPRLGDMKPPLPILDGTPTVSMSPILHEYPSLSSSSSGSVDGQDVPLQPSVHTPTKKRVISAGLISLSPLPNIPKTEPISKRRLEFQGSMNLAPSQSSDNSQQQQATPTVTYAECYVENLLSQNFSFLHL